MTALAAVLLIAGCGDDAGDDDQRPAGKATAPQEVAPPTTNEAEQAPTADSERAPRCAQAVALHDPAGDADPSGDLRRFELRADRRGVCALWVLSEPPPPGTTLTLVAHGPPQKTASGGIIQHGHGFDVDLDETGGTISYGLDRLGSDAARVLRGRVARRGATVSVFVPRAQLDRPPANMPDRPPFPYQGFSFEPRATTAPEAGSEIDSAPDEPGGGIGYVDGELCPTPCAELQQIQPR